MSRLLLILLLLVLAFPAAAQPDDALRPGMALPGRLPPANPVVDHPVWAEAGERLAFTLTSDAFDGVLLLLDAEGRELAFDDDSAGGWNPRIEADFPRGGRYLLRAASYNGVSSGAYRLTVELLEAASSAAPHLAGLTDTGLTDAGLTSQTPTGAPTLSPEGEASGSSALIPLPAPRTDAPLGVPTPPPAPLSLPFAGEVTADSEGRFTFEAAAGDLVSITVQAAAFDAALALIGPDGAELAFDDDSGGDFNPALYDLRLAESGRYEVVLTDSFSGAGGAYTGEVVFLASAAAQAAATATPTPSQEIAFDQPVRLTFGPDGAPQSLMFEGRFGDILRVEVEAEGDAALDTTLLLRDPFGGARYDDDDGGEGQQAAIERWPLLDGSGRYTLVVGAYPSAAGGSVFVTLRRWPALTDGRQFFKSNRVVYTRFEGGAGERWRLHIQPILSDSSQAVEVWALQENRAEALFDADVSGAEASVIDFVVAQDGPVLIAVLAGNHPFASRSGVWLELEKES